MFIYSLLQCMTSWHTVDIEWRMHFLRKARSPWGQGSCRLLALAWCKMRTRHWKIFAWHSPCPARWACSWETAKFYSLMPTSPPTLFLCAWGLLWQTALRHTFSVLWGIGRTIQSYPHADQSNSMSADAPSSSQKCCGCTRLLLCPG